jgi:hypothetical protein
MKSLKSHDWALPLIYTSAEPLPCPPLSGYLSDVIGVKGFVSRVDDSLPR